MSTKQLLSAVATILTFVTYVPYVRAIKRGTVRPHFFSWIIWGFGTVVVFWAQLAGGAGTGTWSIGLSGAIAFYICVLSYSRRTDLAITRAD